MDIDLFESALGLGGPSGPSLPEGAAKNFARGDPATLQTHPESIAPPVVFPSPPQQGGGKGGGKGGVGSTKGSSSKKAAKGGFSKGFSTKKPPKGHDRSASKSIPRKTLQHSISQPPPNRTVVKPDEKTNWRLAKKVAKKVHRQIFDGAPPPHAVLHTTACGGGAPAFDPATLPDPPTEYDPAAPLMQPLALLFHGADCLDKVGAMLERTVWSWHEGESSSGMIRRQGRREKEEVRFSVEGFGGVFSKEGCSKKFFGDESGPVLLENDRDVRGWDSGSRYGVAVAQLLRVVCDR